MKNIAAVTLVAGVLGSTSGTQAGPGYDNYYRRRLLWWLLAPSPPGLHYLPFQFVKRPPLRRRMLFVTGLWRGVHTPSTSSKLRPI